MDKVDIFKLTLSAIMAAMAGALRLLALPFTVLCVLMAVDYATGIVKGKVQNTICSAAGIKGIMKKLCYGAAVIAALGVDFVIDNAGEAMGEDFAYKGMFALIIIIWLIINESISILENLCAIGVPLPGFLIKFAKRLKTNIEKGDDEI